MGQSLIGIRVLGIYIVFVTFLVIVTKMPEKQQLKKGWLWFQFQKDTTHHSNESRPARASSRSQGIHSQEAERQQEVGWNYKAQRPTPLTHFLSGDYSS